MLKTKLPRYPAETVKLACSYHSRFETEHYVRYLELLTSFSSEEIETCSHIIMALTKAMSKET